MAAWSRARSAVATRIKQEARLSKKLAPKSGPFCLMLLSFNSAEALEL
jgi:hypothetical protein